VLRRRRELSETQEVAGVAARREFAGCSADLLPEVAGIEDGIEEGSPTNHLSGRAACVGVHRPHITEHRGGHLTTEETR
jgi:hypothetical protein